MQLYSVQVRLGGDMRNTIPPADRGYGHGIVSWPEVLLLRVVHGGDDTVLLVADAGQTEGEVTPRAEKGRLVNLGYPRATVERLFPGASPRMDMDPPLDEPGLPAPASPVSEQAPPAAEDVAPTSAAGGKKKNTPVADAA